MGNGNPSSAAAAAAEKKPDGLSEFSKARNIPETEHQVLTLQGVTTIAEFSRAISSLDDLQTEVLGPLLDGV